MTISRLCHCGKRAERGKRHCPAHQPRDNRPNAGERGYNARWQKVRKRYLRKHPRCKRCRKPATDVHHVDGYGPLGPRGYDEDNLRALCHEHHSELTAAEQPGGWAARFPLLDSGRGK